MVIDTLCDEDMSEQMALGMVTLEPHPDYVEGGTDRTSKVFFPHGGAT